jgi:hypothetical protein
MANTADAGAMEAAVTGHSGFHHGASQAEVAAHGAPSQAGPYPSYHGRRVSWVAVGIMVLGFLIGGIALLVGSHGPTWWLFWVGCGITVVGLLTSLATNTFEDWY